MKVIFMLLIIEILVLLNVGLFLLVMVLWGRNNFFVIFLVILIIVLKVFILCFLKWVFLYKVVVFNILYSWNCILWWGISWLVMVFCFLWKFVNILCYICYCVIIVINDIIMVNCVNNYWVLFYFIIWIIFMNDMKFIVIVFGFN